MTNPTPTTEPRTERRGGARPGAGAPRGNRNAARKTPREAALDVFAGVLLRDFRRSLPPAIGMLYTMALARAVGTALDDAEDQTRDFDPAEADFSQRRAARIAAQLVSVAFLDAWQAGSRSRDQREESAVRALRPWLYGDPRISVTQTESKQSEIESAARPSIKHNQSPGSAAPPSNPTPPAASLTTHRSGEPVEPPPRGEDTHR